MPVVMCKVSRCVWCITKVTENLSEEILGAAQSVQLSSDSFFSSEGLQGLRELNLLFSNINIQRTTYVILYTATLCGLKTLSHVHAGYRLTMPFKVIGTQTFCNKSFLVFPAFSSYLFKKEALLRRRLVTIQCALPDG